MLSVEEGARIGLNVRLVHVVNLIEQGHGRIGIADKLGVGKQTARDLIGGLCDYYECPMAEVPGRVREELASRTSEISDTA